MRTTFVQELIKTAEHNQDIELITGDLGFGVLKEFMEKFPKRFLNAGIAEQNMLTVAGGLASLGKCVVVYSIGNFPSLRAIEQIRNDICYYNHNVKIICIGGGYTYGSLGMSHHATEDIAVMRAMPNMHIFTPSDKSEAKLAVREMFNIKGPCYLRLERDSNKDFHTNGIRNIYEPVPISIKNTSKNCVFCYGTIVEECFVACENTSTNLYSVPCLKPILSKNFLPIIKKYKNIFVVEEHSIIGGLGDIIASLIAEYHLQTKLIKIGINDHFTSDVGDQKYLRKVNNIDSTSIETIIREYL